MNNAAQTFRSQMAPLIRLCIKLAIIGTPLLVVGTAVGQYRANSFPGYGDLLLSVVIPVGVAAAVAALFALAVTIFTVKVLPEGLRCYDLLCRYQTVKWSEISSVQSTVVYGLPYLYVAAPGLLQPVTLPLWLADMPAFVSAVERQAGMSNILVRALREAT